MKTSVYCIKKELGLYRIKILSTLFLSFVLVYISSAQSWNTNEQKLLTFDHSSEDKNAYPNLLLNNNSEFKSDDLELLGAIPYIAATREESISDLTPRGLSSLLQGRLPGINIIHHDGSPGSNASVIVRGATGLTGNSQPLYVIDGFIYTIPAGEMGSPLNLFDLDDIATISVLKDAAATNIYGYRGANGVIVIETKSGKVGKTNIRLKSTYGKNEVEPFVHQLTNQELWYNQRLEQATYQKHNLSFTSGKKNICFLASASYLDDQGVIAHTGYKRYSSSNNLELSLFDNYLELQAFFQGAWSENNLLNPSYLYDFNDFGAIMDDTVFANSVNAFRLTTGLKADVDIPIKGLRYLFSYSRQVNRHENFYHELDQNNASFGLNNTQILTGLDYDRYFGRHEIKINAMYESLDENTESEFLMEESILYDSVFAFQNLSSAFYGKLNYTFKDRYIFALSLRNESAGELMSNKRISLPSVSLAWNVTNDSYIYVPDFFNILKLRYSYGLTARSITPEFLIQSPYVFGSMTGLANNYIIKTTDNLNWETTTMHNLGLDLNMHRNRVRITADYFFSETQGMYDLNFDPNWGELYWMNSGNYKNNGFDMQIQSLIFNIGDFEMNTQINFGTNTTELTEFTNGKNSGIYRNIGGIIAGQDLKIGDPIGVYYGYEVESVDDENELIQLKDMDGNGAINASDRVQIAHVNPSFYGGIGLNTYLGKFELTTWFNYSVGNEAINLEILKNYTGYDYEGDINLAENQILHNLVVEDASYLKMSDITMAYNWEGYFISNMGFKSIRLSVSARNLLTLTNYSGQDPEFNHRHRSDSFRSHVLPGVDMNSYPVSKGLYLSVEAVF